MSQTNVKQGDFAVKAGEDLTGKEDLLVKLVNDTGVLKIRLPTANNDYALFILIEGNEANKNTSVRPMDPKQSIRLRLKGTCNPGDVLILADVGIIADRGKVRTLPATSGTYRGLAIAEEVGVDSQLVRCRPVILGNITV
jgi:hypothetical protein